MNLYYFFSLRDASMVDIGALQLIIILSSSDVLEFWSQAYNSIGRSTSIVLNSFIFISDI